MSREPSMEDILSSIRKVIAREDAPAPAPTLARGDPEPDILELEDESHAAESVAATAADDELVTHAAAAAARRSLDALSAAIVDPESAPTPSAAPVPAGSRTLDDVVTEALRPMLKAWLDTNLPPLVEGMVAKEIARITGRRI